MPRSDRTFTDNDLIRFYCRNLDPGEKYRTLRRFNLYIGKGEKLCPDDEHRPNPCEWLEVLAVVIGFCSGLADQLPKVMVALTAWEAALALLSWTGPLGRILTVLRAFIAYLLAIFTYLLAILELIQRFSLLIEFFVASLCYGDKPPPLGPPPEVKDLPPDPQRIMDDIMEQIREFEAWLRGYLADHPGWEGDPTV